MNEKDIENKDNDLESQDNKIQYTHLNLNANEEHELDVEKSDNLDIYEITNEDTIHQKIEEDIKEIKINDNTEYIVKNESIIQEDKVSKKIFSKQIVIISIILLFLILSICIFIKNTIDKFEGKVEPNSFIYNKYIGDMKYLDIKSEINDIIESIQRKHILIEAKENTYKFPIGELVKDYNEKKLYNEIVTYNKDKNSIQRFIDIIFRKEKKYRLDIELDQHIFNEKINIINKETGVKPLDQRVKIESGNITIQNGENGIKIDNEKLFKQVKYKLNNDNLYNNTKILCEYINDNWKIKIKSIKDINYKIATYTTTYSPSGGRGENIKIAAKKIDDLILMPKEEFSYEKALGPITIDNGYKNAPVISNGKLVQGIGGGVCQVSSTLYNTQLLSGILPTERKNHSRPVSYVPRGLDATLATGSIDYKFKNTLDYPLVINTSTDSGRLTIEFWSNKDALKGIEYKPVGYASGNIANTYLYGYDKDGKKVYEKHIDTSIYRK